MLKKTCLVLLFISFLSVTHAQLIRSYGFKTGVTLSSQKWDYNINIVSDFTPDNRLGINIGVFSEFLDIPYFSIVTELNYLQKGMKKDVLITTVSNPDGTGEYTTWDTRIDYLNFTLLGKFRLDYEIFSPYIILGPKIDSEINQEHSLGKANVVEENYKKQRFGLKAGFGSEIRLFSFNILTEVLYDYDSNDLYKNENLTVTSNSFDFRIGIIF